MGALRTVLEVHLFYGVSQVAHMHYVITYGGKHSEAMSLCSTMSSCPELSELQQLFIV